MVACVADSEDALLIPQVLCDLAVAYVDMVYRSRWSSTCKGPDVQLAILDKCKASISSKHVSAMRQGIRAVNCCLRGKVSVFYVTVDGFSDSAFVHPEHNFVGVVPEYEAAFNLARPKESYGISFKANCIYKGQRVAQSTGKPTVTSGRKVKCVVDLREGRHMFKCLWLSSETVVQLPDEAEGERYADMKWYPCVTGMVPAMTCRIEFDEFTAQS